MSLVLFTMAAGVGAGAFGAMLGLGGGIFIVPILNIAMGLPLDNARAISLVTVIATSNFVSLSSAGRKAANPRLAMILQVAAATGALVGLWILHLTDERMQEQIFGGTALLVAVVMVARLNLRNVLDPTATNVGVLGGLLHDPDTGRDVAYRVKRVPFALGVAFFAGIISSLAGVGGGILVVPALNSWCGVPMRAAAATSAVTLGITALPAVIDHISRDLLAPPYTLMAAAAVLGVLAGSRSGFWISQRVSVRALKIVMAVVLTGVALEYLFFKTT
ncbi:MAG: hypothetical protein AMXMBFR57_11100 [Acidimicrobiia bacterium]